MKCSTLNNGNQYPISYTFSLATLTKQINEGNHRKRKKIINKTRHFYCVGSCKGEETVRPFVGQGKTFYPFTVKKSKLLLPPQVLVSFLREADTSRGSPCSQPFRAARLSFLFRLQTVLGVWAAGGLFQLHPESLRGSKDSLHGVTDNFKSVVTEKCSVPLKS